MCILCVFIRNWEKQYNRVKYPLTFYNHFLKRIKTCQDHNDLFNYIFLMLHWKFGTVKKGTGEPTNTITIEGESFTWSSVDIARDFEECRNDADFLQKCFQFRNGVISGYEFFRYIKEEKRIFPNRKLVPYVFLMHLLRPEQYPMIDQHVWRAMNIFQANLKSIYEKPKTWSDYEQYIKFFNNIVESLTGEGHIQLDRQTIDRGLWSFGKWIHYLLLDKLNQNLIS